MRVEFSRKLKRKGLKNRMRRAIPVHAFWAYGDLCIDEYESQSNRRYMYVFPANVATEGGGIVARTKSYTIIVIYGDDRAAVVEGEGKIYGLFNGKVYVLDDVEDIDNFFDGYEDMFNTIEEG